MACASTSGQNSCWIETFGKPKPRGRRCRTCLGKKLGWAELRSKNEKEEKEEERFAMGNKEGKD